MNGQNESEKRKPSPLINFVTQPDIFTVLMLAAILVLPLLPGAYLLALPIAFALSVAMMTFKAHLPYRLPLSWKGTDYGSPQPGTCKKFRSGEGLLFLGNKFDTQEEIWISNSDARRHALVLATTGAGKALPDDALILTPSGWRRNGDLRPGDKVMHPSGKSVRILSCHPQGPLPPVQLTFADGRQAVCSRDHLWRVKLKGAQAICHRDHSTGLWTAADIGIAVRLGALLGEDQFQIFVPLPQPMPGHQAIPKLTMRGRAARNGLEQLSMMPSLSGSPEERFSFLAEIISIRGYVFPKRAADADWLEIPALNDRDGFLLRHMVWSLGGLAMQLQRPSGHFVQFCLPGQEGLQDGIMPSALELHENGLEVTDVEGSFSIDESVSMRQQIRDLIQAGKLASDEASHILKNSLAREMPMTCIRIDVDDGMFVSENYLPTHNTELLLGMASQSLMWSSGFLFIDGKGTTEFHAKSWSIVSKFGRQDDYRVLNFTDGGSGEVSAGGPGIQSNTLNPFNLGSADQLMNLIVSLMGESGSSGEMWRHRAMALVTTTMKALVEMRDAGDIMLDVQTIRDYLPLGLGVKQRFLSGQTIADISELPEEAWIEMRQRGGLIELYLRALNGEFSEKSRLALKSFFDSLPGFSLERAINGESQDCKAAEQYGFLSMQLTKPLGSLADDFGHIFCTPIGEVDMDDVVLNRRILVVLLPALQKAPEEMRNCGRIIVSMLKMMMGRAAGSELEGNKKDLVDNRVTNSPSPFIAVLDEAGYYMVKGIDTMMAQARSLGFMIVIAGQDMASMQSISPQIAETAAANARLTVAGATEDATRTWQFLRSKFARHRVAVASGQVSKSSFFTTKWVARPDRQFIETDRVPIGELQKLREGEFYFLMESRLVKARAFHIGECWTPWLAINRFLTIRGPDDPIIKGQRSDEGRQLDDVASIGAVLLSGETELRHRENAYRSEPNDRLSCAVQYISALLNARQDQAPQHPGNRVNEAGFLGLMFGARQETIDQFSMPADGRRKTPPRQPFSSDSV